MTLFAIKRIEMELLEIQANPADFFSAGPNDEDLFLWDVALIGPVGSPFEGGLFFLRIYFPDDYPESAPEVSFITPIFHPNINPRNGRISLDILDKQWSIKVSISTVILAISTLLFSPNTEAPLIPDIAKLYNTNRKEYNEVARTWTKKYSS